MFESLRMTVVASRVRESGVDPALDRATRGDDGARVSVATAFHLATAAGGDALDLRVGRFDEGYAFDAVAIDPQAQGGTIRLWGDEPDDLAILQSVLMTASRANVAAVWTGGRRAGATASR
jgi:guanine deaminase